MREEQEKCRRLETPFWETGGLPEAWSYSEAVGRQREGNKEAALIGQ